MYRKSLSLLSLTKRGFAYIKSRGLDILRNPQYNKDTNFTIKERQLLGIHGLLPPAVNTIEEQVIRVMINLRKMDNDLNRHLFLLSLQERNETLFYKVVIENVEYCMPLIYTPTVGLACQKYSLMFRRPRGLFITIHDKKYIRRIFDNWAQPIVKAIVVTDGERILGLGDLGTMGMGIPIGKLSLYTALAGVPPEMTLPILLDVGTNNQELLDDPLYIGLRHKRVRGEEYEDFFDKFMKTAVEKYGRHCLIQFEDFGAVNAYKILNKYKDDYCVFNDDIQGTASVCLAAILGAEKLSKRHLKDNVFLFCGAGSAATGIANLIKRAMYYAGISDEEARKKIYMYDMHGLLTTCRSVDQLTPENTIYTKEMPPIRTLEQCVDEIKPTVLIGVSGVGGTFTPHVIQSMSRNYRLPYIFALSNPTSKAECTAKEAYTLTNGNCIFACGSPFDPVEYNDKIYTPSQCNNSYIFPGIALAVILFKIRPISLDVFLVAAKSLSQMLSEEEIAAGRIFPSLYSIREVSINIAIDVAKYAYRTNCSHRIPEPQDKYKYITKYWYTPNYKPTLPRAYRLQRHDHFSDL